MSLLFALLLAAAPLPRPQGPCDIYAAHGAPCAAAHSSTRALYANYSGPLYQVLRLSDGKTTDIGVVPASATDPGGYANAAAQDTFCANTTCFISILYDQSPKKNHLVQAPRGGFSGPALGGFNTLPLAHLAPISLNGHKVYGVFIPPGTGLRQNDVRGTAVDDQAEGQYWVINGQHYNNGCCFDYGNAEIDSRDDGNGTMETTYYGNATPWYRGVPPGPWIMTDQENNLVGCVNPDGSKFCSTLPTITWRFVTATAHGKPHHWTSMGADAQRGPLQIMFDGPRIDHTYDPMRKQGAILLGNGGDNSVGSQGTFYEGAMTAAGTFPSQAADQAVQANIVAAKYDLARLAFGAPMLTFAPGSTQELKVTFNNTTGGPVQGLKIALGLPAKTWSVAGQPLPAAIEPGAKIETTFRVTAGPAAFNGDLTATANWMNAGRAASESAALPVRNGAPVKINEYRVSTPANPTNSFIELYNPSAQALDLSGFTLTHHAQHLPVFSSVKIPAGTRLAAKSFYLLGLANSGLAVPAKAGDATLYVRSIAGLTAGSTVTIGSGPNAETRKIKAVGTAAGAPTTLWQPLPDGPVMTVPAGSSNVPVTSTQGFAVGEKLALGHGATYPTTGKTVERYEVVTLKELGKPGTQAYLAIDTPAGSTNLKLTSVANLTAGDKIRLDIDSPGHGIETVTLTKVGTQARPNMLTANAEPGATTVKLRGTTGLVAGDQLTIGTPANWETVTITAIGAEVTIAPALKQRHLAREEAIAHGTGVELAAPTRFHHAANLPFAARGTGLTFAPASAFAHSSNEPVLPLGTGITLDAPLAKAHEIDEPLRDAAVTTAGYQGPAPQQWFGGPALSPAAGVMILRDANGLIIDSLNYGLLADPWAAEGDHSASGTGQGGCRAPSPAPGMGFGPNAQQPRINRSAGRYPDGADTDSNCADFLVQPATTTSLASVAGATNLKVASVAGLAAGQAVLVGDGETQETATLASVGTAGATTLSAAVAAGATQIPVAGGFGFTVGQSVTVGEESATVAAITGGRGGASVTVKEPLKKAHAQGEVLAGTGLTFAAPLAKAHERGAQVTRSLPTPGAPNVYFPAK